jgi:hypothetical protein
MSAPIRTQTKDRSKDRPLDMPSMYAPPWARDTVTDAADAALTATNEFRRSLPPVSQLDEMEPRKVRPFDGDVAIRRMRERPSLDPVMMPAPPAEARNSAAMVLARVAGAVGLAALAAFFVVGASPLQVAVKAEGETALPLLWPRLIGTSRPQQAAQRSDERAAEPAALADRFAAMSQDTPAVPVRTVAVAPEAIAPEPVVTVPTPPPPSVRTLDQAEIGMLYRRGEELTAQGDIAAARLMFARAAEAGDARAALALGASYDPDVLKKLGVVGVAADPVRAREWYAKAAEFGSGEATRRLAQSAR